MKIRTEINAIKTKKKNKKTIQRINETKSCFFKNVNKMNKPLANLTRWKREKNPNNKIRDEKLDITTNTNEIQRMI
jgi:hypothetical protein